MNELLLQTDKWLWLIAKISWIAFPILFILLKKFDMEHLIAMDAEEFGVFWAIAPLMLPLFTVFAVATLIAFTIREVGKAVYVLIERMFE